MKVNVVFLKNAKTVAVKQNASVLDALEALKINPETVIVKRGKEIVTEEEALNNKDEIEIIKIVSGG
jgi:sulfur carrier protein